jgi:antitoxin component YwqK of YwqJK toxin-antitoxin module
MEDLNRKMIFGEFELAFFHSKGELHQTINKRRLKHKKEADKLFKYNIRDGPFKQLVDDGSLCTEKYVI